MFAGFVIIPAISLNISAGFAASPIISRNMFIAIPGMKSKSRGTAFGKAVE